MNRTIVIVLIILALVFSVGANIARTTLGDSMNKRMDSSEAVLINEIDARLYSDFHKEKQPENVQVTTESLEYTIENHIVRLTNNGDEIEMKIQYPDGESWTGNVKGNIEVEQVEVININGEIKVDLSNTTTQIFAITYKLYEDFQKGRTTLNRDFTRYLSVEMPR